MNIPAEILKTCWVLAGPTACGKSALSLVLSERLNAEIISLDSMAVYRDMDIGTAKPTAEDRSKIPHHLLDVVDPHEEFSTAQYLTLAERVCREILDRGRTPFFVGGTGLYLRAILRGLFSGPPADWAFRSELEQQAAGQPTEWLWNQLRRVDPASAERLHPNDRRRLVRALEIHYLTGELPSQLQQQRPLPAAKRPLNVYWLHPQREWLARRIDARVDRMFESGLVDEVHRLVSRPHPLSRTARQALGYREVIDWLTGELDSEETTRTLIQTRTRQFAKRQHTWFRNLEECREVRISGNESVQELCDLIMTRARENS